MEFDFANSTLIDNGIMITDKTKNNPPRVRMENSIFEHSTYTLNFKVLNRKNYELYNKNKMFDYTLLSIVLEEDEMITFPISDLDNGLILLFNEVNVTIEHNKPSVKVVW